MSSVERAFTSDEVTRFTSVSRRRLAHWLDKGVLSADVDEARGRGRARLCSFANLVEVRVALWLRAHVSVQLLREVVAALRRRGLAYPLAEVSAAVVDGPIRSRVPVLMADGSWEEPLTGQIVMELVVPVGQLSAFK
ncbi:MAG: hypothetical protein M0Z33_06715 [Actinomycetota bacterium]|nr:hypothetical protein [Actinomycetota bacterium]